jgi:hypothetical protein
MKRLLVLSCLLIPLFAAAEDPLPKDLLTTAFARIDYDLENFLSYSLIYDVHSWVRDGDDVLEEEYIENGRVRGFTPDSTETEIFERRKVFGDEEDLEEEGESKHEDREEGEGEGESGEMPELNTAFRERHEFRFIEWTERGSQRVANFEIYPRKKKKHDYWKGNVWFGTEAGELVALELRPAKRQFGLKALRIRAEYEAWGDRDLPLSMDMDIEIKVPIIVHKKVSVEMRFTEFELLVP